MIKVSVVIPVYNAQKYLEQCLSSVVDQTLKEIEIICVNDGSTDGSPGIIRSFMEKDPRVRMIDKKNGGYGQSVNMGFDAARGEYLGIVEADDFAAPEMFEKLYGQAKEHGVDVMKGAFFDYYTAPRERIVRRKIAERLLEGRVFRPSSCFRTSLDAFDFFNVQPSVWSAVYRTEFIRGNGIRFLETPGASYQDTGFNFKVWSLAKRVMLTNEAFLYYRQDNTQSSVNSPGKAFCICDEYAELDRFLKERPALDKRLRPVEERLKHESYMWNYRRLSPELRPKFLERFADEMRADIEKGYIKKDGFERYAWKQLMLLLNDPEGFSTCKFDRGVLLLERKSEKALRKLRKMRYK